MNKHERILREIVILATTPEIPFTVTCACVDPEDHLELCSWRRALEWVETHPEVKVDPFEVHPEERFCFDNLSGFTLEVGCGDRPTPGVSVTLDHIPSGGRGVAGSQKGRISRAQVCADMEALPFRSGAFESLVARHLLEHHPDTVGVLAEWGRVADRLVLVCPDQDAYYGSTVALDPTHRAAFTPDQLSELVEQLGMRVSKQECPVDNWSFALVAEVTYVRPAGRPGLPARAAEG